jgi:hypothetical protein
MKSLGKFFTFLILLHAASPPAFSQQVTQPSELLSEINNGDIVKQGCKITAVLAIDSIKKIGTEACPVPEPTQMTKIACAVALALQNKTFEARAVTGTAAGCRWVVTKVSNTMFEVSLKVEHEAEHNAEEAKAWVSFLNTVGGAQWFMNRLN